MTAPNPEGDVVLAPCPFCGGTNLVRGGDDKMVAVFCGTCGACGPDEYGSSNEWNRRAALQPSPAASSDDEEGAIARIILGERQAINDIANNYIPEHAARHIAERILAALPPVSGGGLGWQPIETAPKDGTEFQAWLGAWMPRARFNPETETFETWGRVDYDEDGWDFCDTATHWMPLPSAPLYARQQAATGRERGE